VPLGAPWGSEGGSEPPWRRLGHRLGACRLWFSRDFLEKCVFAISMPLSSGMATCAGSGVQVGAMWAYKSRPNGPKWLRRSSRSEVWTVSARSSVGVMEIARELPHRSPDSSQVGGQSLSKRQVI
jgi:hypothetical protein